MENENDKKSIKSLIDNYNNKRDLLINNNQIDKEDKNSSKIDNNKEDNKSKNILIDEN